MHYSFALYNSIIVFAVKTSRHPGRTPSLRSFTRGFLRSSSRMPIRIFLGLSRVLYPSGLHSGNRPLLCSLYTIRSSPTPSPPCRTFPYHIIFINYLLLYQARVTDSSQDFVTEHHQFSFCRASFTSTLASLMRRLTCNLYIKPSLKVSRKYYRTTERSVYGKIDDFIVRDRVE